MANKHVRGSVISGYLKFVERTWGKEGLEKCLVETNLKDMEFKDGGKYSNAVLNEVITWISKNYGMEYVRKAGRHTVKNLGLLAYIVRFTSIETMLEKAKTAYQEAYDFGVVNMEISEKHAVATMKDSSEIPENCEGWIGAMEALLELTHTKGIVKKTKCQLRGDDRCEYEVTWS